MGLGIVILFYLMISAVLFIGAAVVCWIVRVWIRDQHRWLRPWLIVTPILVGAAPTALLALGLLWMNFAPPSVRFHDVFGIWPSRTVHDLRAHGAGTNDAEWIDLAFAADEATWSLLTRPPFKPVQDSREIGDLVPFAGDALPPWWRGHRCADRVVRRAEHLRQWDEIVVTRCRSDGRIYVQARWVQ